MKLQDVLLKAMAKKITWWEAAEIIGVTDRTMRRWRERMETGGYSGLADRRKGQPSDKRIPLATVERVLGLYKETYFDLNIRHFHEKLSEEHGIHLSYTWVQKALQGAGLVARGRKRRKHRRRRERRPMAGMLLHIDGSKHQWFGVFRRLSHLNREFSGLGRARGLSSRVAARGPAGLPRPDGADYHGGRW